MNWFRKHVKSGSRLALMALAIQFALAFGHFHGVAHAAPTVMAAVTDAAVQPSSDNDSDGHNTDCATCAVLSLANNFLFVTSPHLELPQVVAPLCLASGIELPPPGSSNPAFRSRAPPLS